MENKKIVPKRRFAGFTDAWEQHELSKLNIFFTDGNYGESYPKPTDLTDEDKGVPFLTGGNLKNGLLNVKGANYITKDKHAELTSGHLEYDDIVIAVRGSLGALGYVNSENQGWNINSQLAIIRTDKKILRGGFLIQYLISDKGQNSLLSKTTGSALKQLPMNQLKTLIVPVTNISEQMKIEQHFKKIDNLITLHQRKLEKMKNLKSAYLSEMFPAEGECKPKRRFAGFTDAWEQRTLRELTSIITKGTTPLDKSGNGKINFIKIESIDSSSGEVTITSTISDEEHNGYLKRSQLQEGDILFSIAGTLGRVTSVNKDILPANTNQALAIIRLKNSKLNYITTYLKGKSVAEFVKKNPTVGAQPNLSLEQVGNLGIALPNTDEQEQIGRFFFYLDNLITLHQRKLEKLQNIKKAYLNEMFI